MGLFSGFQSAEARRAEDVRTGAVAPDRTERARCWESRDAYFACLDRHDIVDALKDDSQARKACPQENVGFERDCAAAWVKYFKQWRVADIQKKARIAQLQKEGAQPIESAGGSFSDPVLSKNATSKADLQDMLASKRRS